MIHISGSADGFVAGRRATLEEPAPRLEGGERSGESEVVEAAVARTGAVVMGRRMWSGGSGCRNLDRTPRSGDESAKDEGRPLGIVGGKAIPRGVRGIGEVAVSTEPRSLPRREIARELVRSVDKSEQLRDVCSLRIRKVVPVDRSNLHEDGAEKVRSRKLPLDTSRANLLERRSTQRLRATGHPYGPMGATCPGVDAETQAIRSEHVN